LDKNYRRVDDTPIYFKPFRLSLSKPVIFRRSSFDKLRAGGAKQRNTTAIFLSMELLHKLPNELQSA